MITMYTTPWCSYCKSLKRAMTQNKIDFEEVNIEEDENSALKVAKLNGGNQTVPTLVFADGTAITNPTLNQVRAKVA